MQTLGISTGTPRYVTMTIKDKKSTPNVTQA
jgi:hypothetical protein